AVYASRPPSPATTQHSLQGGSLLPYPGRTFTGWTAPASPGALITDFINSRKLKLLKNIEKLLGEPRHDATPGPLRACRAGHSHIPAPAALRTVLVAPYRSNRATARNAKPPDHRAQGPARCPYSNPS